MRTSLWHTTALIGFIVVATAHAQRLEQPIRTILDATQIHSAAINTPGRTGAEQQIPSLGKLPIDNKRGNSMLSLGPGDSVGYTYYDFQTNSAMPNRIIAWPKTGGPEGVKASMVWMAATDQTANTTTRGTYGAITDGTDWYSMNFDAWSALEVPFERSGFCSIDHLSDGRVVIAKHAAFGTAEGHPDIMIENSAGSGAFTKITVPNANGGLWPRMAVGANNRIHVIWTFQTGSPAPPDAGRLVYSSTTDNGFTWTTPVDLAGPASATGITTLRLCQGGDAYAISANGDNVVVWYYSQGVQIVQVRSSDGGMTWPADNTLLIFDPQNEREFFSNMYPDKTFGVDSIGFRSDTAFGPASSIDVLIDADGTVHGAFPIIPMYLTRWYPAGGDSTGVTTGGTINLTDFNDPNFGMMYFHANPDNTGFRTPLKQPGNMTGSEEFLDDRSLTGSISRWAQLGKGTDGEIYLAFGSGVSSDNINLKSLRETAPKDYLYSHIYAMWTQNGREWSNPVNLTPDKVDCQWPSLADLVDGDLYIAYGIDTFPGDWLTSSGVNSAGAPTGSELHPQLINNVEVMKIAASELGPIVQAGVDNPMNQNHRSGTAAINSVTPNPSHGAASLSYSIGQTGEYSITLFNTLGKKMMTLLNQAHRLTGSYTLGFDVSTLPAGTYLVVLSGQGKTTTARVNVTR